MLKKVLKHSNLVSLVFMIIITGATQVLGVMKSSIAAGIYGATAEMDAYNFANSIATFIFGFFSAGITTVVIPEYVKERNNKELNSFFTVLVGIFFIISALLLFFRFPLISSFSNREADFINVVAQLLFILLFSNFLVVFSDITAAFFQCENKYNIPKLINLFSQIIVVIVLLNSSEISIYNYALIIASGLVINFILDTICAFWLGWRIRPDFHIESESTKRLFIMFFPVVISTGMYRLSLLVDSTIALSLDVGRITVLSYSNQIASMVSTLIIGNLLIYIYPKIVKRIKNHENQLFFWNSSFFFHAVVCLVIAGFIAVGRETIELLFEHGKFNAAATNGVYFGVLLYIFGQQSNIVRDLLYRYFYALGDTKTAATNSIFVGALNIVLSVILVKCVGFYGIILGTIISSFISLLRILMLFGKHIGFFVPVATIFKGYLVNIIVCFATVMLVLITKHVLHFNIRIFAIFFYSIETVVIYSLMTYFCNRNVINAAKSI